MNYGRTYNFSAGPAMMPEAVLEEIRDEMMNYRGSGMCVMEMSHRSKVFQQIADEAEQDLRELMHIPDNYKVLFIQGGATLQFAAIPWNLMKNGKAVYIETGAWSKKAITEAKKYGEVIVAASSKDRNFSYIPDCSDLDIPEDADYVYICENETIHGLTYQQLPNTKGHILVSDQSSMFLSKPCNVEDYGLIYAGVQKNVGPAGMSVVIIREDLIREDLDPKMPVYMRYDIQAKNGSMYNTPNCWAIYCCGKVFKYLKSIGGLEEMARRNEDKAKVLYDFLDSSKMFRGTVDKEFRSLMKGHQGRRLRQPEGPQERGRPARQHLQRHAQGGRRRPGRVPDQVRGRAQVRHSPAQLSLQGEGYRHLIRHVACVRRAVPPSPQGEGLTRKLGRMRRQFRIPHSAFRIINRRLLSCVFWLPTVWTRRPWPPCGKWAMRSWSSSMSPISWAPR